MLVLAPLVAGLARDGGKPADYVGLSGRFYDELWVLTHDGEATGSTDETYGYYVIRTSFGGKWSVADGALGMSITCGDGAEGSFPFIATVDALDVFTAADHIRHFERIADAP